MVAILVTPAIRDFLGQTIGLDNLTTTGDVTTVTHGVILRAIRKNSSGPTFQELVKGAEIYLSHADAASVLAPPKRNPELDRRVKQLRARLENDQYARIVRDVARTSATDNIQLENLRLSKLAPQLSLASNVIVTMATCFVAAYFIFKHSTGSQAVALAAGVIAMIAAMIVEVILLITKLYRIDNAVRRHDEAQQQLFK